MTNTNFYLGCVTFANTGVLIYEKYIEEMKVDSHLLTGMLSALQALSREITDQSLDEFEFHKFQIYIMTSTKYNVSYAVITNGAFGKSHAYDLLSDFRDKFEKENRPLLEEGSFVSVSFEKSFNNEVLQLLESGNNYLKKLERIRSEFIPENDDQKLAKKDELRDEFF